MGKFKTYQLNSKYKHLGQIGSAKTASIKDLPSIKGLSENEIISFIKNKSTMEHFTPEQKKDIIEAAWFQVDIDPLEAYIGYLKKVSKKQYKARETEALSKTNNSIIRSQELLISKLKEIIAKQENSK